jgi:hypothetical protein
MPKVAGGHAQSEAQDVALNLYPPALPFNHELIDIEYTWVSRAIGGMEYLNRHGQAMYSTSPGMPLLRTHAIHQGCGHQPTHPLDACSPISELVDHA